MAAAAQDLFRRLTPAQWASADLLAYACAQWPRYQIGRHHVLIADHLEALERGEISRLLVMAPPRHGKTFLVAMFFVGWWLGRRPDSSVIYATYNQERANDVGRMVRERIADPTHAAIFRGQRLRDDSQAAHRFHVEPGGGSYYAVGVGGPITGRGADLLIIDDPHKGRDDASSEVMQRRAIEWYSSVAYTRLHPGARVVMILTRWDEEDLAGQILERGGERWTVLKLKALAEDADDPLGRKPGEALWPERYPVEELERIRATILPRDWRALYQQEPTAEEGDLFRRDWVRYYDRVPDRLRVYGTSDFAVTSDGGDYTEHAVWGIAEDGRIYALDWWHGQTAAHEWIDRMLDLAKRWKPVMWYGEAGVIRRAVEPWLWARMRSRGVMVPVQWLPPIGDKVARARSFQARMGTGQVMWPRSEWAERVIDQLMRFPNGRHDDAVDACSLLGRALDLYPPGKRPARRARGVKPFTWEWLQLDGTKEA